MSKRKRKPSISESETSDHESSNLSDSETISVDSEASEDVSAKFRSESDTESSQDSVSSEKSKDIGNSTKKHLKFTDSPKKVRFDLKKNEISKDTKRIIAIKGKTKQIHHIRRNGEPKVGVTKGKRISADKLRLKSLNDIDSTNLEVSLPLNSIYQLTFREGEDEEKDKLQGVQSRGIHYSEYGFSSSNKMKLNTTIHRITEVAKSLDNLGQRLGNIFPNRIRKTDFLKFPHLEIPPKEYSSEKTSIEVKGRIQSGHSTAVSLNRQTQVPSRERFNSNRYNPQSGSSTTWQNTPKGIGRYTPSINSRQTQNTQHTRANTNTSTSTNTRNLNLLPAKAFPYHPLNFSPRKKMNMSFEQPFGLVKGFYQTGIGGRRVSAGDQLRGGIGFTPNSPTTSIILKKVNHEMRKNGKIQSEGVSARNRNPKEIQRAINILLNK